MCRPPCDHLVCGNNPIYSDTASEGEREREMWMNHVLGLENVFVCSLVRFRGLSLVVPLPLNYSVYSVFVFVNCHSISITIICIIQNANNFIRSALSLSLALAKVSALFCNSMNSIKMSWTFSMVVVIRFSFQCVQYCCRNFNPCKFAKQNAFDCIVNCYLSPNKIEIQISPTFNHYQFSDILHEIVAPSNQVYI